MNYIGSLFFISFSILCDLFSLSFILMVTVFNPTKGFDYYRRYIRYCDKSINEAITQGVSEKEHIEEAMKVVNEKLKQNECD